MTSAVGGINKNLVKLGDLMLLKDHMFVPGLALRSPLVGKNDERFGPRFPSSTDLYDKELRQLAQLANSKLSQSNGNETTHPLKEGVYAMVGGPQFETPAEIRWLQGAGCDVVGMSVCHETVVARHCGIRVLAFALITNLSETDSDAPKQAHLHEDVLKAGESAARETGRLIREVVKLID